MRLTPDQVKRILLVTLGIVAVLTVVVVALVISAEQNRYAAHGTEAIALPSPKKSAESTELVSAGGASLEAYRGLGSWVDVWDVPAWRNPEAAVEDMASHGVRTLYLQSGNYSGDDQLHRPDRLKRFIRAAHARGMKVVAWYLPNMRTGSVDYVRIMRAIKLRTSDGQAFDSFGLDIEDTSIHNEWERNKALETLSRKIRDAVGPTYPLSAIVPPPVAMAKTNSMWHHFPYQMLAGIYDVFQPMGYYTDRGRSPATAYADVRANLRILRSQPGCTNVPIHLIGGIAESSSDEQVSAFVRATLEGKVIGASLYSWPATSRSAWRDLAAIRP